MIPVAADPFWPAHSPPPHPRPLFPRQLDDLAQTAILPLLLTIPFSFAERFELDNVGDVHFDSMLAGSHNL